MRYSTLILLILSLAFTTSCKKAKLSKKVENSSWELSQVMIGTEDKTAEIKKIETVYTRIEFSSNNNLTILKPTRDIDELEEVGEWTLEKIVPTVGKSYYLIKNSMAYSQKRTHVFNLHEYGSEVMLSESNQLTQTIGDYTLIYEKVN